MTGHSVSVVEISDGPVPEWHNGTVLIRCECGFRCVGEDPKIVIDTFVEHVAECLEAEAAREIRLRERQ